MFDCVEAPCWLEAVRALDMIDLFWKASEWMGLPSITVHAAKHNGEFFGETLCFCQV
jgi:hypothetical protein